MTNNSDGLSPSLRAQLGKSFGRSLPAPFAFENGIYPDGVNDYLTIPRLAGVPIYSILPLTIELWGKGVDTGQRCYLYINFIEGGAIFYYSYNGTSLNLANSPASTPSFTPRAFNSFNHATIGKWTVVSTIDVTVMTAYKNGLSGLSVSGTSIPNLTISSVMIFSNVFTYSSIPFDELRLYNRNFSDEESRLNYNNGIGENPSKTEGLIAWYKFQEFETLDFSMVQDGSDMRLGIRDFSGQNNHALPFNMDTNPASGGYVLKPF